MIPDRFREDYDEAWARDERAEQRADALREEFEDAHPADTTCDSCGHSWWGNWTRGSRIDPPEPRNPYCPECGA